MIDQDFDAIAAGYEARLYEEAADAAERSYETAARPNAEPREVTYADLRCGDYMTNEGPTGRWVRVVDLQGPAVTVKTRRQACADGEVSVLFEIPEPVHVSGETRYWIERPADQAVLIDMAARRR